MKAALKLLLPLLFLSTAISGLLFTSGCKEDLISGDTTTVANPNLKIYRNLVISEYFDATSFSSINLNDGAVVDADNAIRDAELADSVGLGRDRFYLRSGDGNRDNLAIGQETKFVPFFTTRSATYPQSSFDAITRIDPSHVDPLLPTDFYKYSTFSLGRSFASDDIRVYGFWLKGKKVNYGLSNEVYGLIYLKSIETVTPIGGVPTYKLTVDVKVNQKGLNDFRERVPSTN